MFGSAHRLSHLALVALCAISCGPTVVKEVGTVQTTEESSEDFDSDVLCGDHPVDGDVTCEASESKGSCGFECSDAAGRRIDSECSGGGCRCIYQGQIACTCIFNDPGATCAIVDASCCPAPWR